MRVAISPQSVSGPAAERPASAAQLTGLNFATQRIQPGSRLCCISAVERKVSGSVAIVTIPISVSRWRVSTAMPLESEAKTAPSSPATAISTATPSMPLWKCAPTASARPITIRLWMTRLRTDWATLPRLSAPRQIGETSSRSMVPRLMSSMKPIPIQAEDMASMTTTPGVRNSM